MSRFAHFTVISSLVLGVASVAFASDWIPGPSLNTARAGCAVATDPAYNIYVTGGRISWNPLGAAGTATNTVEVLNFNAPVPSWTVMPQVMNVRREFHSTACVGGFLYAFGGSNSLDSGTVYFNSAERIDLLNPLSGWQPIRNMPTARNIAGAITDNYGRIYVIGGSNGTDASLATVERYDPFRNQWETLPSLHDVRGRPGVARDCRGRIYAIGGGINQDNVASVERFDPAHPESGWQFVASIPTGFGLSQSVTATTGADGRIYLPGGATAQGPVLDRCIRYDPDADQWEMTSALPTPLAPDPNASVTDCNGRMWLIGAYNAPVPQSATYCLRGPCGAAAGKPALVDDRGDGAIDVSDLLNVIVRWGNCPN